MRKFLSAALMSTVLFIGCANAEEVIDYGGAAVAPAEINHADSLYFTRPDFYNMTSTGDRIILSHYPDEYTKVVEMASAMRRHELASKLITGEASEQSVYWKQRVSSLNVETEIWCKSRPDYVKPMKKGYVIVDIKTTQDAHISEFQRKAYYKYYYHLQAAHYIRGFEAVR